MKRICNLLIIFLFVIVLLQNITYAIEDIKNYCPSEPYPVGGKFASTISKISGTNWLND